MLVHKNGNSRDTVLWSSSFADFLFLQNSKSRDAMWWSSSFVDFLFLQNQQIQRCHVVKFQFCWISSFCRISKSRDAMWCSFELCRMVTSDTPCDKVPVLLISWFCFCFADSASLQICTVWCQLWHHSCNSPTPNMFRVQSSTFVVVSCPDFGRNMWTGHEKTSGKCWSAETKVWKQKYEVIRKASWPFGYRHSRDSVRH